MTAPELAEPYYPAITAAMLTENPNLPPADLSVTIDTNIYGYSFDPSCDLSWRDASFTTQMKHLTRTNASAPQAYFLTANSAIPVADCIRGFYSGAGQTTPHLYSIQANSKNSGIFFIEGERLDDSHTPELQRLAGLCKELARVCVVDQYVHTGKTASYAARLLLEATTSDVSIMQGNWYHQADVVNAKKMTSPHARFMRSIGKKAFAAI